MRGGRLPRDRRHRRFDHAHRARRRRLHPGAAAFVGLATIALAVALLRPWGGDAQTAQRGGVEPGARATPAVGRSIAAPTLGAHGDVVPAIDPGDAHVATRRDTWVTGSVGPLPPALLTGYEWPIRNARITNAYGPGRPGSFRVDGLSFHDGLDLSSFCGARITAAHDGVVLAAGRRHEAFLGWIGDLGPFRARLESQGGWGTQAITVVIDDGNGYRSVYAHLGLAAVAKGEIVRAGDLVGWEGASGNATGCHLHYALFSPHEKATLSLDPRVARKTKLPPLEIARIDPLLVLPPLAEAGISWNWGAR